MGLPPVMLLPQRLRLQLLDNLSCKCAPRSVWRRDGYRLKQPCALLLKPSEIRL